MILPSKEEFAKDLSIWSFAETFPALFAPLIAGILLDAIQPYGISIGYHELGYQVIFGIACLCFVVSGIVARKIDVTNLTNESIPIDEETIK